MLTRHLPGLLLLGAIFPLFAASAAATCPSPATAVTPQDPVAPVTGSVRLASGVGLGGLTIALFDAATLTLVETAVSNAAGEFTLVNRRPTMHLFAQPTAGQPYAGQWLFGLDGGSTGNVAIVIQQGQPVSLVVKRLNGSPVVGARVRAYDARADLRGNIGMTVDLLTDATGRAEFRSPPTSHIAVLAEDQGLVARWRMNQRLKSQGNNFEFVLSPGVSLQGKVRNTAQQPLAGMAISGWSWANGWHWSGHLTSDADGQFSFVGGAQLTQVHATDPAGNHVSNIRTYNSAVGALPDIVMPVGNPVRIVTRDAVTDAPVRSEIRFYSYENGTWSWGGLTDANGVYDGKVSTSYAVTARPLNPSYIGSHLWSRIYGDTQVELDMRPTRLMNVRVRAKSTNEALDNVEVRAYTDDWIYLGRAYSDANGLAQMRVPQVGLGRFYVVDTDAESLLRPSWHTANLAEPDNEIDLALPKLQWISGDIRDLGASLVGEDVIVTAFDADTGARTSTAIAPAATGQYSVRVWERYHLTFASANPQSRWFPLQHWWNEASADTTVHARNPARMASGWWGDVQVRSIENDAPVAGIAISGGHPSRTTGADGWARNMLLRAVYSLRNTPPPVSKSSPNPIIPDINRPFVIIEQDRTEASGNPLPPFRVFNQTGTVATGRVVGPLPDGTVGPISGVSITAHGGRRILGTTTTDRNGDFAVLGVKYDPTNKFTTSLWAGPSSTQPYLPVGLNNLVLTNPAFVAPSIPVGTISLPAAAFGTGQVVDPFEQPITNLTVFFNSWYNGALIGGGRVSSDGSYITKIAPNTRYEFFTRFWNNGWERKLFNKSASFTVGQKVQLDPVQMGKAAIVEIRTVAPAADSAGYATPITGTYVELLNASTGLVYDWRRTDSSGEAQLRGPMGVSLRLRYSFWWWTYTIGGVEYELVDSEFFLPQLSEPFTLTSNLTDFGDVFIVSTMRTEMEALRSYLFALPPSAFVNASGQRQLLGLANTGARVATPAGARVITAQAKRLIEAGIDIYDELLSLCPTLITDPTARDGTINRVNAVLNDLALLYASQEDV